MDFVQKLGGFYLPHRFSISDLSVSGCHENNEELQAAMLNKGLEEGRSLLNNPQHTNSLAAEFEAMSENEVRMDNLFNVFILL